MPVLSDIMISAGDKLLSKAYRDPAITAYNRLEPRPRTEDFETSLRAEIRDALWMLTRQWQMGELESEDAGSAIDARILTQRVRVDRIALEGTVGTHYDDMVPMEPMVEREAVPFTHARRVQVAQYFLQLHSPALRTKYLPQYLSRFGFDPGIEDQFRGQVDGLNLYNATKKRAFDGEKLYQSIVGAHSKPLS
jgi:hypothetical protein